MVKKAAPAVETKSRLGRPGNNLQMGIVGLPNVGKSSLFNVMTQCDLGKVANFPYATIDPTDSKVIVPDDRFDKLCTMYKPKSEVPAFITCVDIAGLKKGASTGEGLGNNFLSHVRAVDGIYQVVRAFDDAEVIHVEGDVDPTRDMTIIADELRFKDTEWMEKTCTEDLKDLKRLGNNSLADKARKDEIAAHQKVLEHLQSGKHVRKGTWTVKEIEAINKLQLLTAKTVIYLVNLSQRDYLRKKNKYLPKIKAWIDENSPGDLMIPFSVVLEESLAPAIAGGASTADDLAKMLADLSVDQPVPASSALGKITKSGYDGLDLIRYFTCGPDEVRAWTIQKGTKAPQAAGVIHTDFELKFVCGEVHNCDDLFELGTENAVKAAGKIRQQGRTYEVVDGDIIFWKHG